MNKPIKLFVITLTVFLLFGANTNYREPYSATIKEVLNKSKDEDIVVLFGKITHQIDDDEFIFEEKGKQIKIEIESYAWQGKANNKSVINNKVKITATVDKERFEEVELKATKVELAK